MIDWLESIDQQIVLTINGWNSPFLDEFMWIISGKITWIPLYAALIAIGFYKLGWKHTLIYIGCVVLAVGLTDFICSGIIKGLVQRYRPSHHLQLIHNLHFYRLETGTFYQGGQYGFVSSHAGNFVALSWTAGWILKPWFRWLLPVLLLLTLLICYSRIYLGVHYLSDIIGGAIIGTGVALVVYRLIYLKLKKYISE